MGMTIDEAMNKLREILTEAEGENSVCYVTEDDAETLQVALSTMHKYQKIRKIIDDWENSGEEDDPINIIDNIEEVINDGNK